MLTSLLKTLKKHLKNLVNKFSLQNLCRYNNSYFLTIYNFERSLTRKFPDALIENYESLVDTLKLPDEKDRHVLAAAIKTNANVIVTNNIKDFPNDYLSSFGLTAKTADDFLTDTIDLNNNLAIEAFRALVLNRTNSNLDEFEILDRFRKNGLNDTANYLHALL